VGAAKVVCISKYDISFITNFAGSLVILAATCAFGSNTPCSSFHRYTSDNPRSLATVMLFHFMDPLQELANLPAFVHVFPLT
jgi:hypothetical protein